MDSGTTAFPSTSPAVPRPEEVVAHYFSVGGGTVVGRPRRRAPDISP